VPARRDTRRSTDTGTSCAGQHGGGPGAAPRGKMVPGRSLRDDLAPHVFNAEQSGPHPMKSKRDYTRLAARSSRRCMRAGGIIRGCPPIVLRAARHGVQRRLHFAGEGRIGADHWIGPCTRRALRVFLTHRHLAGLLGRFA